MTADRDIKPYNMQFVGGPLDGQERMTRGFGFDSGGALYRPKDGKMQFIGYRRGMEP